MIQPENPAEAHINELLSGYIDGELTQQDWQRVDVHLAHCRQCADNLSDLRALRKRMGQAQLGNSNTDHWREKMEDTGVKISRGIGWILLICGILAVIGIGVVGFLTTSSMGGWEKLIIGSAYIGLGALLISVVRQRLIERKSDRYKDVEI